MRARLWFGMVAVLAITCTGSSPARPHSWYPKDCCSNRDCMPAESIGHDKRGDMVVSVGHLRIWVPKGFIAIRPSADDRIHICFYVDDYGALMPLCLFLPAQS